MKKSNTLYLLQRKYGPGNRGPWKQIAIEDLYLPQSYVRDKSYREQMRDEFGLHQLYQSQKAPWFADLEKVARYIDRMTTLRR